MTRRRRNTDPAGVAAFEAIHALPEAKPFRAAALYYAEMRRRHGPDHALTRDAEENCYRQMFALHPSAHRALTELMEKKR